jgi:hypothetical protein
MRRILVRVSYVGFIVAMSVCCQRPPVYQARLPAEVSHTPVPKEESPHTVDTPEDMAPPAPQRLSFVVTHEDMMNQNSPARRVSEGSERHYERIALITGMDPEELKALAESHDEEQKDYREWAQRAVTTVTLEEATGCRDREHVHRSVAHQGKALQWCHRKVRFMIKEQEISLHVSWSTSQKGRPQEIEMTHTSEELSRLTECVARRLMLTRARPRPGQTCKVSYRIEFTASPL